VPFFRHLNDEEREKLEELLEPASFASRQGRPSSRRADRRRGCT
jgi:hypothetical protein